MLRFASLRASRRSRRTRRAFTLIELLIVILVLAILMAVALPLYLAAVSDSQLKTCRANMQTIANAEAAYKTSSTLHQYTTNLADLNSNLGATPICPQQGTYSVVVETAATPYTTQAGVATSVPAGGLVVSCSYTGANGGVAHGSFAPGIDSQ